MNDIISVAFANKELKEAYFELEKGKFEEKQLFTFIQRAINDLKLNPVCGIRIPKKLWPKEYLVKYSTTNLWKYDLPDAWRLIYTIKGNNVEIICVILEWFNHKEYERRFHY
ncbi:hypothetical protein J4429_02240 [Candidatus Pacearchaeota archaeon]|nr:hypothetical protein [Candidatus Pacearchaeota archaeon]